MKYIKAIDVWAYGQAIRDGQIKLQSGQWVRLGENGPLSRFHEVTNGGVIRAFHAPLASLKYLEYVWAIKAAERLLREQRQQAKRIAAMEEAGQLRLVS